MFFLSLPFLIIFLFLLIAFLFVKKNRVRKYLLLFADYLIYAWIDWKFLALLVAASLFIAACGSKLQQKRSKTILVVGVIVPVILLLLARVFGSIFAPIGLSFFLLQGISYLVDLYRGKIEGKSTVLDVLIYISFFPLIVSGPIMKARDFLPQLDRIRKPDWQRTTGGMQRFLLGVFEKLVIADRLAVAVNAVYAAPSAYSGTTLLFTAFLYLVRLYFDFAGYTHMAIAISDILGFRICENFDLPFLATDVSGFWRRWHISLSSWLTEYVYFSMGGSRCGELRTCFNLLLTMVVSGLWHGLSFGYLLWGAMNGGILILQRFWTRKFMRDKAEEMHPFRKACAQVLNSVVMVFLFIPFALGDPEKIRMVLQRIFTLAKGAEYYYAYGIVFLPLLILIHIFGEVKTGGHQRIAGQDLKTFKGKVLVVLLLFLTILFAYFGNTAFIYEQF